MVENISLKIVYYDTTIKNNFLQSAQSFHIYFLIFNFSIV